MKRVYNGMFGNTNFRGLLSANTILNTSEEVDDIATTRVRDNVRLKLIKYYLLVLEYRIW